jgi:transcriptional regulator with XRE-family HTH domain
VQLAETLDIAQSTVNAYESGQRRVPVSALPVLAKALGVSLDELLGEETNAVARKRGPTPGGVRISVCEALETLRVSGFLCVSRLMN